MSFSQKKLEDIFDGKGECPFFTDFFLTEKGVTHSSNLHHPPPGRSVAKNLLELEKVNGVGVPPLPPPPP